MNKASRQAYQDTIERDNAQCIICGNPRYHIHHILNRSLGGANKVENLVLLCKEHHDQFHKNEKVGFKKLLERQRTIYKDLKRADLKKGGLFK